MTSQFLVLLLLVSIGLYTGWLTIRDLICLGLASCATFAAVGMLIKFKPTFGTDGGDGLLAGATAAVTFTGAFLATKFLLAQIGWQRKAN